MGLRLIYGRAGTGKSEKCYKEISEKIKQNNKILIITPLFNSPSFYFCSCFL